MKNISAKMASAGKVMTIAGAAITAAFGLTVKAAIGFNKEVANIATLIPGSTKRVDELKSAIRDMAVKVGKDTTDLAEGAYQVISAFGDTADTVGILGIAAKAATAGVATTTDAIDLLSAVTKGYGDTSKEAVQKASDLAFQTVTLGQTTFPELAASIGKVIPLTSELGVSQEELFAVMATGTGVTGKAAEVSTQLRGIMQSLMSPTADMTELLKDKEYASGKAMLADLGLAGALDVIKDAAEASNMPLQKYISSIEGQTLALALTGTQADTYISKLASMKDSIGLTDVAFKEQTEGVNAAGFAFEQAKQQIIVMSQTIGDQLLPMLVPLIQKITEVVGKIREWVDENPKLFETIVKVTAVIGAMAAVGGPILMAVAAFMKMKVAINVVIGALKLIGTASAGPIGILIGAVGSLYLAWETNLFGMRDITEDVFGSIKGNFVDLADTLGGGGGGAGAFFDEIKEKVKELVPVNEGATESFTDLSSALKLVNKTGKESVEVNEEMLKSTQEFADAMQPIYDKLYEMYHTKEEVAVKALEEERDAIIKTVKATEQSAEKIAEAIAKINLVYDGLISKVNGVASATESSANRQVAALQKIVDAAGKVTAVKLPGGGVISTGDYTGPVGGVQSAGSYEEAQAIVAANAPNIPSTPSTPSTPYVPNVSTTNPSGGTTITLPGGGTITNGTPSYAVGTPYVPKTQLALLHKGEAIIPATQNTYDQSNNNSTSLNIQPGAINIVTPKFSSADGQELFRQLERQIKMRGLKLVRA